jgi:hypothetical protein
VLINPDFNLTGLEFSRIKENMGANTKIQTSGKAFVKWFRADIFKFFISGALLYEFKKNRTVGPGRKCRSGVGGI